MSRPWLVVLGLLPGACALAGYDFGDYERASVNHDSGAAGAGEAGVTAENGASSTGALDPVASTTFGVGGESAGGGNAGGESAGGGSAGSACEPRGCFEQALDCGPAPAGDGCGQALDCGACFWWFQECRQNRCQIIE